MFHLPYNTKKKKEKEKELKQEIKSTMAAISY